MPKAEDIRSHCDAHYHCCRGVAVHGAAVWRSHQRLRRVAAKGPGKKTCAGSAAEGWVSRPLFANWNSVRKWIGENHCGDALGQRQLCGGVGDSFQNMIGTFLKQICSSNCG